MSLTIRRLTIPVLAALLVATACGDDAEPGTSGDDTGESTTTTGVTVEGDDPVTTTTVDTTTTPSPGPDRPACVGDDWVEVDAGPFAFLRPFDLVDQEVQGIDSLVGHYRRTGMTAGFDYGWYSGNETTQYPDDATSVNVDGLAGDFVQVDTGADVDPESRYLTYLYVPIPGDDDEISQTALAFWARYADEADGDEAACMTQTFTFS